MLILDTDHFSALTRGTAEGKRPLVERIAALEQEVATIKTANARRYAVEKPYLKSAGMLPDDEITRDAERLGRAWRKRQK